MSDQLPLIGPRGGLRPRAPRRDGPASEIVATVEVLVEAKVPHLARAFTYGVPRRLSARVVPGCRVRVRLAGRPVGGYVLGPGDAGFDGPLHVIDSVVSAVPVLTDDVLRLCRAVADHYAGTVPDVVRLAVPPRVASAERQWAPVDDPPECALPADLGWLGGHAFTRAGARGRAPRAAWSVPAGLDWQAELAGAAVVLAAAGRSTLVVVPDATDLDTVRAAVADVVPADAVATLSAHAGPAHRYREFLRVLSGQVAVVIGTRAAAFAPVRRLGLVVVWDDGDPSLADQRAPYPHAREVLALRSHQAKCALLLAGPSRSTDAQRWVEAGWLRELGDRARVRANRPRPFATADHVRSPFDASRRWPDVAVRCLREGLALGPVLVQVARRGYVPLTACQQCRKVAACPLCDGPLQLSVGGQVSCRRCGDQRPFQCAACGGTTLRAVRTGAQRTAEELGRLFLETPVLVSTADHPVATVPARPAVVVATSGVEPRAEGGYQAGALPDAQDDLWRVGLRAREDAVRRWFATAALLRPGAALAVNADPQDPAVQALIRWDPAGFAAGELALRRDLHLPPAEQIAQVDGAEEDVRAVVDAVAGPGRVVLGPRPVEPAGRGRALVRAADFSALVPDLRAVVWARAAAHEGGPVRVQVDPVSLE